MFWRNHYVRLAIAVLSASIVMFAVIVLYDLRYTHFGMPYDWKEVCQAGRIRAAVSEGDTLFERQIRGFAAAKNLECSVKYCENNDELWLELLMFHVDVVKLEGNGKTYSWTVRENSTGLRDTLDVWYDRNVRYISRYDSLFKQCGDSIGWDWKLLAAIGCVESHFRNVQSRSGLGVMQLSKVVARRFGAGGRVMVPEYNIKAAAGYIQYMDHRFAEEITDSVERQKFVIAAYNSGMKPVVTARSRAKYAKKDNTKWEEVKPYYRNNHSKRYLKKILKQYEEYKHRI